MKTTDKMLKTKRQGTLLIAAALLFSAGSLSAAVTNISQLDAGCTFSFAAISDTRGHADQDPGRAFGWIQQYHDFVIEVGDVYDGNVTSNNVYQAMWRTNTFRHNNTYPCFGNHCSKIDGGDQYRWGIPYFTLTNLNQSGWTFRATNSTKIKAFKSSGDQANNIYTYFDDRLIDYYVDRTIGNFNVHIITIYKQDHSVFDRRSGLFLYNRMMTLAASKTTHDIIIVQGHSERWLKFSNTETFAGNPVALSTAERDFISQNADIVLSASDHRFRRISDFDFQSNCAIHMDSGVCAGGSATDNGYLEFHVFDDTNPFMTVQYINSHITTRELHIGQADGVNTNGSPSRDESLDDLHPLLKYISGGYIQPLNWSTVNLPGAPPPATTYTSTFYSVAAYDGYVDEYSETSNTGGVIQATMTDGAAIRVGDTGAKKQRKGFLSFDCSPLPDACTITKATLRLKRGGGIGTPTSLSNLTVDVKNVNTGWSDNVALQAQDFQGPASASSVAALSYPATTNSWSTGDLNATGLTKITKTTASHTQYRVRFNADDDNDTADDYLGFYSGEAATGNKPELIVVYQ